MADRVFPTDPTATIVGESIFLAQDDNGEGKSALIEIKREQIPWFIESLRAAAAKLKAKVEP